MEVYNKEGALARQSSTGIFYCGRRIITCHCCDGVCGPDSGCNCDACAHLPHRPITCPDKHVLTWVTRDNGWTCDASEEMDGCRRGITNSAESRGVPRFRCAKCDYDLCDRCYSSRGGVLVVGTTCPKRHPLRRSQRPDGWVCDGELTYCCNKGDLAVSHELVLERYRCTPCDYDLCGYCYLNFTGPPSSAINFDGALASLGQTGKYYCGGFIGRSCGCCDGRCGPNTGCNCLGCHALDVRAPKRNRDGAWAVKSEVTGRFYCRRRILSCGCCDGYCGPSNGCNCDACQILDLTDPQVNRDGRLAVRGLGDQFTCENRGFVDGRAHRCRPSNVCRACRLLSDTQREAQAYVRFSANKAEPTFQIESGRLRLCLLCDEDVADVKFLPCGHDKVCSKCSIRWKRCIIGACSETIVERKRLKIVHSESAIAGSDDNNNGSQTTPESADADLVIFAEELRKLRIKQQELEDEKFCAICLRAPKNAVFDCGHVACIDCANKMRQCHACRHDIVSRRKVYF